MGGVVVFVMSIKVSWLRWCKIMKRRFVFVGVRWWMNFMLCWIVLG